MGLGDRLRARKRPTEVVRLPHDPARYSMAERELELATRALADARAHRLADLPGYQERADAARSRLEACECEEVTIQALPPAEWEALVDLHPATEEQRTAGALWNITTFRPALLATAVVPAEGEEPLSEADWEQLTKDGALAAGELNTLFNAAVQVNFRVPPDAVGKD